MKRFATIEREYASARSSASFALVEQIRHILAQEQDHQIALGTALGMDLPDVGEATG